MRILVIEDEPRLARNIARGLTTVPSFVADVVHDGEDGEHLALTTEYDLVILDLMLPGRNGLDILQAIRAAGKQTPVLILTALSSKEDVVRGLDYGSDDYLAKPFDMGELLARVKALVRRSHGKADPVLRVGPLEVNTHRHVISCNGRELLLPALEYRLLEYLAYRKGVVVSKTELSEHLYDYNWEKFSNVIEVYVSGIRRKLEHLGAPRMIHTLRGQGYMLGEPQQEPDEV